MKYYLLFSIILNFSTLSHCQPFLYKCATYYNGSDSIHVKYVDTFDSICKEHFNGSQKIFFFSRPSFDPEYALQIKAETENCYILETIILKENLYYKIISGDTSEVDFYSKQIDSRLFQSIDSIFKLITTQISPKASAPIIIDGSFFKFVYHDNANVKCGESFDDSDKVIKEVVGLCNDLIRYSKGELELDKIEFDGILDKLNNEDIK